MDKVIEAHIIEALTLIQQHDHEDSNLIDQAERELIEALRVCRRGKAYVKNLKGQYLDQNGTWQDEEICADTFTQAQVNELRRNKLQFTTEVIVA